MNTPDQYCCISTKSQLSMRKVFNYCSLPFLVLVLTTSSWFIQSASAQAPSGTLTLVAPSKDPTPGEAFVVSVEIKEPQNASVFTMTIEYPDVLDLNSLADIVPGAGQFSKDNLTFGDQTMVTNKPGRVSRRLSLNINRAMGEPVLFTEGVLFTITFRTMATIKIGNYQIAIVKDTHLQNSGSGPGDDGVLVFGANELPSVTVPVRGEELRGTVNLVKSIGDVRVGETSFIDIELHDRSRAHRYEITVDPSASLGPLTVSYNSDDMNTTAITNHTAGDPITISADTWLPSEPLDYEVILSKT